MSELGDDLDAFVARLSRPALLVVFRARHAVSSHSGKVIDPEHILIGLLGYDPDLVTPHLSEGWTARRLKKAVEDQIGGGEAEPSVALEVEVPLSNDAREIFSRAVEVASQHEHALVEPMHLLVALSRHASPAARLLAMSGVTTESLLLRLRSAT